MPLNWEDFDKEAARKAGSAKLNAEERVGIEELAAQALAIPQSARSCLWGAALGYGRDAEAIVQLFDRIEHRYLQFPDSLIVKIYRTRKPAFGRWHGEQFGRMPAFSGNPLIQQSVAAGEIRDWRGKQRSYAILQYVPGTVLDAWLADRPEALPEPRFFLEQIFLDMIIPLWSVGHRGWDLRSGNMVVNPATRQLTMIDTDSYQNTFEELTVADKGWTKRDDFESRFFDRGIARLVTRMLPGNQDSVGRGTSKELVAEALDASGFRAALHRLGRPNSSADSVAAARRNCARFLDRLRAKRTA